MKPLSGEQRPAALVLVLDVGETLTDLSPLAARLEDVGLPGHLLPAWFAGVLRDGVLTPAGGPGRAGPRGGRWKPAPAAYAHALPTGAATPVHARDIDGTARRPRHRLVAAHTGPVSVRTAVRGPAGDGDDGLGPSARRGSGLSQGSGPSSPSPSDRDRA